ncbi:response regulator [Cohnella sp. CFH 77786]|uniref:response regulator transcription factor n=1 Tax=Cohnella sp. CFH 77786 TaxID=2662265 RepID=UPI001C609E6F|nr:response regulator transcription factor [Cohnella sp. CFH 77786]MBW5445568.1 response regulator [Cohnella sp. CFH 77786]
MRIMLADDHTLFRAGIRNLLAAEGGIEIVGEVATGEEAISKARELRPDVILMDIRMPGRNGIEATRAILETCPDIKILILTMFRDDQSVFTAMRAGARGYMLKDADEEELLTAIRVIAGGGAVFGADIAARMMQFFSAVKPAEPEDPAYAELSSREKEILALIAEGCGNADIGAKLHLSVKTVANYVTSILSKLQVQDRTEARKLARQWKLDGKPADGLE